jgi:hypothetical protein
MAETKKKMPWPERYKLISEQFPRAVQLDWHEAFKDIEVYGRLIRDISKIDDDNPGRSGPRPALDRKTAEQRYKEMLRVDYSEYEFQDAFRILAQGRSIRSLAAKTGLDRNMVQKLLAGKREPDIQIMEQIAAAFKKRPAYFLEYRVMYVLGALEGRMLSAPEMTVDLYKKLCPRGELNGSS